MLIRDILKKKGSKTITTSKETKVVDVAHILTKEKIGAIVIVEKEEVIGILSERDIVQAFTKKKNCKKHSGPRNNDQKCIYLQFGR